MFWKQPEEAKIESQRRTKQAEKWKQIGYGKGDLSRKFVWERKRQNKERKREKRKIEQKETKTIIISQKALMKRKEKAKMEFRKGRRKRKKKKKKKKKKNKKKRRILKKELLEEEGEKLRRLQENSFFLTKNQQNQKPKKGKVRWCEVALRATSPQPKSSKTQTIKNTTNKINKQITGSYQSAFWALL